MLILPVGDGGTLANAPRKVAEKRQNDIVCASHDLAPIFGSALGVQWDKATKKATNFTARFAAIAEERATQKFGISQRRAANFSEARKEERGRRQPIWEV